MNKATYAVICSLTALLLSYSGFFAQIHIGLVADHPDYIKSSDDNNLSIPEIIINEILYRRESAGKPEFVELLNLESEPVDLSNWILADAESGASIPIGTVIPPGGYLVFTDQPAFASSDDFIIYLPGWPGFSNSGDYVVLRSVSGLVSDSLRYSPDWGNHDAGVSLERRDPLAISIDPANWGPSRSYSGSTPAGINTIFEADRQGPVIEFANTKDHEIEILFSEFIHIRPETEIRINEVGAVIKNYNPGRANRITLSGIVNPPDSEMMVRAENLVDFQGNVTPFSEMAVARPLHPGDLVINEIMYHELSDDPQTGLSQSEYLELANTKNFTLSLEGIYIHDAADEHGNHRRIDFTDTDKKSLPPGEYAIIYPEPYDVPYHMSRTGRFFEASEHESRLGLRADRVTLSLVNSGKEIYLADSAGIVLDYVFYDPLWHNPNLTDTQGISLERISAFGESNHFANWTSSSAEKGGTPASMNTAGRITEAELNHVSEIQLQPNPFSPDGDGFDDTLIIRYQFSEPDFLIQARIYDRYGRHIRTLANNKRAGLSGELQWDGLNENGNSNRIGMYIILIEAFNGATGTRKVLRKTAVLARHL
jgi:hypothetical protein